MLFSTINLYSFEIIAISHGVFAAVVVELQIIHSTWFDSLIYRHVLEISPNKWHKKYISSANELRSDGKFVRTNKHIIK